MDYTKYSKAYNAPVTQQEVLQGREEDMVENNSGGYGFAISPLQQLKRFLVLGSEGGTYYVTEEELTKENTTNVQSCLDKFPTETVDTIVDFSVNSRGPKQNPILFAYALACSHKDKKVSSYALSKLTSVCQTATQLFMFLKYAKAFRGKGYAFRNAVAKWYTSKKPDKLAYQVVKYRNREGYTHRDAMRISHPKTKDAELNTVFNYAVKGFVEGNTYPNIINAFEELQKPDVTEDRVINLISNNSLPWETVPDKFKSSKDVWEALAQHMPYTATLRNLNKMTQVGHLTMGSEGTKLIANRIVQDVKKGRVHPIQILMALRTYSNGKGIKGSLTWTPVTRIVEALEESFYLSVDNVEPTNKRIIYALDVSGSMSWGDIMGCVDFTPADASAALAMINAKVEQDYMFMAFSDKFQKLDITRKDSLSSVQSKLDNLSFGATDCSLPMRWAEENKVEADAFVIYTDSESYYKQLHPSKQLEKYEQAMGMSSKVVVVGMTATDFSIADPLKTNMLDVVGFDSATPSLINGFISDKI